MFTEAFIKIICLLLKLHFMCFYFIKIGKLVWGGLIIDRFTAYKTSSVMHNIVAKSNKLIKFLPFFREIKYKKI